jgi:hypothetical protein
VVGGAGGVVCPDLRHLALRYPAFQENFSSFRPATYVSIREHTTTHLVLHCTIDFQEEALLAVGRSLNLYAAN